MIDSKNLERAIIGCILMNGELFTPLKADLVVKDFSDYLCSEVYAAMTILEWRGVTIDPITVINQLRSQVDDKSKEAGRYIEDKDIYNLANQSPGEDNFEEYVQELIATRGLDFERANPGIKE